MENTKVNNKKTRLLVLSIASVFFVLAFSGWMIFQKQRKANTQQAGHLMFDFYTAQRLYLGSIGGGNYANKASDLGPTESRGDSCPFDLNITSMHQIPYHGYVIASLMTIPKTSKSEPCFSVVIIPQIQQGIFRTGDDCFFIDQTNVVRHSGSPMVLPDANSPPLYESQMGR